MANYFGKPFAASGTRTTVPEGVQADGSLSLAEGWGPDYERNPIDDAKARRIERAKMNYILYLITDAIGEVQRLGSSTWSEAKMPYDQGATCYYSNATWVSLVGGNSDKPGITDKWFKLSAPDSTGGSFDPDMYYTRTEMDQRLGAFSESIANFSSHISGDIYPVSRTELEDAEYVCDGSTIPITSSAGMTLNDMDDMFKLSWGIRTVGTTRISLPALIGSVELPNEFTFPVFSPTPGYVDGEKYNYLADSDPLPQYDLTELTPTITHKVIRFTPVIYLESFEDDSDETLKVFFEGVNAQVSTPGANITIRQVKFGLYTGGVPYVSDGQTITMKVNSMTFTNAAGTAVSGGTPVVTIQDTDMGVVGIVTLATNITVAKMSCNITFTVPDIEGGATQSPNLVLTNEVLS